MIERGTFNPLEGESCVYSTTRMNMLSNVFTVNTQLLSESIVVIQLPQPGPDRALAPSGALSRGEALASGGVLARSWRGGRLGARMPREGPYTPGGQRSGTEGRLSL